MSLPGKPPSQRSDRACETAFLSLCSSLRNPWAFPKESCGEGSGLKSFLGRAGARTREALEEAICLALLTVTSQDAQGWFEHCGYLPAHQEGKGEA
jgi:hypothetical protein